MWKHLRWPKVVRRGREGWETHYHPWPNALAPLMDWMQVYDDFWNERFDRLEELLKEMSE